VATSCGCGRLAGSDERLEDSLPQQRNRGSLGGKGPRLRIGSSNLPGSEMAAVFVRALPSIKRQAISPFHRSRASKRRCRAQAKPQIRSVGCVPSGEPRQSRGGATLAARAFTEHSQLELQWTEPEVLARTFLAAYAATKVYWNWVRLVSIRSGSCRAGMSLRLRKI
jgi:hypothetical protein